MPTDDRDPIVITGLGMVTPFAANAHESWPHMVAGRAAVRMVDLDGLQVAGAPLPAIDAAVDVDPVISAASAAALEAVRDARIQPLPVPADRVGIAFGSSKGGLAAFERAFAACRNDGAGVPADWSRLWMQIPPNAAAMCLAERFGVRGPVIAPVAACATGLAALVRAAALIEHGDADVAIAGAADASLMPIVVESYRRLGVLARSDEPASACRPFDAGRNGFVIGEGAAAFVLERASSALSRGVAWYAEFLAGECRNDAHSLTGLDPQASAGIRLLADVLRRAQIDGRDVNYVNLHGTATRANDIYETRAVRGALETAAAGVRCSSLKGGMGHLLGAAGAVETAATLLAMRDAVVPPTVNLEHCDPGCDLDYTPRRAVGVNSLQFALKVSLGFGGHIAAAAFARGTRPATARRSEAPEGESSRGSAAGTAG